MGPPPPTGLERKSSGGRSSSISPSSRSCRAFSLRCVTCGADRASAGGSTGVRTRFGRIAPKTWGGSGIGARPPASASDCSAESLSDANSRSTSPRADAGRRSSIAARARFPSSARYRRVDARLRASFSMSPGARLPDATSNAWTARLRSTFFSLFSSSTKIVVPSVQADSPGSPGATSSGWPARAEASSRNRPSRSAAAASGTTPPPRQCNWMRNLMVVSP